MSIGGLLLYSPERSVLPGEAKNSTIPGLCTSNMSEPRRFHRNNKRLIMNSFPQTAARLFAAFTLYSFVMPVLAFGLTPPAASKSLTEDQKIIHVLNRLGFGARPGDVEKVKKMGLEKYIDQQLNPSAIDDSAAEAK